MSDEELITYAQEEYSSEDVEVDQNAVISRAFEGAWVAAWVWVPDPPKANHE